MSRYGIFINHRHDHRHLAGRIYDYFKAKGMNPFLDVYSLRQVEYEEEVLNQIAQIPYFLCVLTKGSLDRLDPSDPDDLYFKELKAAFESKAKILVVESDDFEMPEVLPKEIQKLLRLQRYPLQNSMRNFFDEMDRLYQTDIVPDDLEGINNWREEICRKSNVLVTSRWEMEHNIATLERRFGKELIDCVKRNVPFEGVNQIKHINMSCYAASLLFAPDRDMVDYKVYDAGMMFHILSNLFQDKDFSMVLIANAPDSFAAKDSITNYKLGNSSFEENPKAVFLSSYASLNQLFQIDPYRTAKKERRFKYFLTENVLPFAYFQIIYKDAWREFNHIKIDLYTEGLNSNSERRSMLFFEKDNEENYRFLEKQFEHLKESAMRQSSQLVQSKGSAWLKEWEDYWRENKSGGL